METTAHTRSGPVEGRVSEGVLLFGGIPYAAPPVGPLRFAPPRPHAPWTEVRPARRFGDAALQPPGSGLTSSPPRRMSEDCLTLNVTTPALDDGARPVLFWIHGGAFRTGQGAIPWYNGASFAKRGDIVTVSINYRLGAFGFSDLSELEGEELADSGALGILDQLAALGWVRDNIAAFGGDPSRVTVAGESAGAMSVGTLLGAEAARGLFRGAIAQSGATAHVLPARASRAVARALLDELGVRDLGGLRALPGNKILDAQQAVEERLRDRGRIDDPDLRRAAGAMPFQPALGGPTLPKHPLEHVQAGGAAPVALLIGTNAHETTLWNPGDVDDARLDELARDFGLDAPGALAAYRAEHPGASAWELMIALTTDQMFRIPALRLAEAHTAAGGATWMYRFSWESRAFSGRLRSTHALEIPFAFNNLERMGVDIFLGEGPVPSELAERMHDCWIAFVRDGSPSTPATPWDRFDTARRRTLELGDEIGLRDDPLGQTRAVWG